MSGNDIKNGLTFISTLLDKQIQTKKPLTSDDLMMIQVILKKMMNGYIKQQMNSQTTSSSPDEILYFLQALDKRMNTLITSKKSPTLSDVKNFHFSIQNIMKRYQTQKDSPLDLSPAILSDPFMKNIGRMDNIVSMSMNSKAPHTMGELQALHDRIQSLYKVYDKQQKQLIHLTHDPDKIESFAVIEQLAMDTADKEDQLRASIEHYNRSVVATTSASKQVAGSLDTNKASLDKLNQDLSILDQQIKQRLETAATRDRMLQLSQERNIYKKKVIYVLLAIIIALITAILASYNVFSKK